MTKQMRLAMGATLTMLISFGCAEKRNPAFPDDTGKEIFALSDFGSLDVNAASSVQTDDHGRELTEGEKVRALYAAGVSQVIVNTATVPEKLRFMFENLELYESPKKTLKVVFTVAPDFVTVYKVVSTSADLNPLERGLALSPQQIQAETKLANTTDAAQISELRKQIRNMRQQRPVEIDNGRASSPLLVPLFKYKVESFGNIERKKNEMKEATAVLQLSKTRWSEASHVQVKNGIEGRILLMPPEAKRAELEQIFLVPRLNIDGEPRDAKDIAENFGITSDFLQEGLKYFMLAKDSELQFFEANAPELMVAHMSVSFVKTGLKGAKWQIGTSASREIEVVKLDGKQALDLISIDPKSKVVGPKEKIAPAAAPGPVDGASADAAK